MLLSTFARSFYSPIEAVAMAECAGKACLILAVALVVARLLRGGSAALRHLVLWWGLAGALLAPILPLAVPRWSISVPAWLSCRASFEIGRDFNSIAQDLALRRASPDGAPRLVDLSGNAPWLALACIVSGSGTFLLLLRLAARLVGLACLARRASSIEHRAWTATLVELSSAMRLRRPVRLVASDLVDAPLTFGAVWPVIAVPADHLHWTEDERRMVLCHELSHVKRGDAWSLAMAEIVCAVYWFVPLSWLAKRALGEEQERACDDCVLACGSRASAYAALLLAWCAAPAERSRSLAVAMAGSGRLQTRLLAILDADIKRQPVGRTSLLAVTLAFFALAAPLAAVSFSREEAPRAGARVGATTAPSAAFSNLPAKDREKLGKLGAAEPCVADLERLGYGEMSVKQIAKAKKLGIDAAYIRAANAGRRTNLLVDELIQLKKKGFVR